MWTAKLIRLNRTHGRIEIEISYTDGAEIINKSYQFDRVNKEQIKRIARDEAKRLGEPQNIDMVLNIDIDLTEPIVTPPPAPTQAQIDRKAWFDDWDKLQKLILLSSHGMIQPTDTRITNLQTTLKASWKNAYLQGI